MRQVSAKRLAIDEFVRGAVIYSIHLSPLSLSFTLEEPNIVQRRHGRLNNSRWLSSIRQSK